MANHIGIIILAAGNSSRLGQPKQLLKYKDKTLLTHAMETAIASRHGGPVMVVTGALHDELFKECNNLQVSMVHNVNWALGMSTSIHSGLRALVRSQPDASGALVMLCDQPLITTEHLNNLMDIFEHHKNQGMVATSYANTIGVPAVFSRDLFEQLYQIKGDKGARDLFDNPTQKLITVPYKPAAIDVDTMEDYEKL
jgi:molybdenum cofactor cytidylyltransferase